MKKPNLFIVGVTRGGTTSLAEYLKQHPEVFIPEVKGIDYFGDIPHPNFPQYFRNEKAYLSLFKRVKDEKFVGDASHLFCLRNAPERVKKFNPKSKIIILLRDPVEIIESFYAQGSIPNNVPIETSLKMETEDVKLLKENLEYSRNVRNWIKFFGKNNVYIILSEDMKKNPKKVFNELCDYLKIQKNCDIDFTIQNRAFKIKNKWLPFIINAIPVKLRLLIKGLFSRKQLVKIRLRMARLTTARIIDPKVSREMRKRLRKPYKEEIRKVSKLIGRDLSHWLKD